MEKIIVYIVLVALFIGILWHIFGHLMIVFHPGTTDLAVKEVLKDPHKYMRYEHMCYFMRNMVYLFFMSMFLTAACTGNMIIKHESDEVVSIETKFK